MFVSRTPLRRTAWLRVVGGVSVLVLTMSLVAVWTQPALPVTVPPGGGRTPAAPSAQAAALAREESKAFVARSRLSTAELIRAARRAGARLAVHTKPPAPKGIPVHPPIIVTRSRDGGRLATVNATPMSARTARPAGRKAGSAVLTSSTALSGQVTSPQNEGQTSTIFSLQAQLTGGCGTPCSATTYNGVTFQYRVGTAGTFANIPASAVSNGGAAVTWPVATSQLSSGQGVQSPNLTWLAAKTLAASGLLQIQAVFTDGLGDSYTTSPVTVTLDKSGTGSDFATGQVGPAIVGLQSGNLSLAATDVSIDSYGSSLVVMRTFNTMAPGTASMFGPGWTSSLPVLGTTMIYSSVTDNGSYAVLTGTDGSVDTFAAGSTSNGVTAYTAQGPAAADGLVLTKSSPGFTLTDPSGDQIQFTAANSSKPNYYTPSQITQPGASRSVGVIFDATSTDPAYGKPLLMVAPNPNLAAGTSSTTACPYPASASTWAAGCRGLQFAYNSSGKLTQVSFVSYDGSALTTTAVAAYSYDATGRLSGEWDPRISPTLVTSYTYDENSSSPTYGWLTSVSPAQQSGSAALAPWTFSYNTTASSRDYGKLISVTRTHSDGTKATQTIAYQVPLTTGAGGPITMDAATVGTWNQTDVPASAAATFPATHVPANPPSASDWQYAEIAYYDADGREVNTADYGSGAWNIDTTQYDGYGDVISQLSAADRAEALAAGASSASVAAELETVSTYTTAADGSQQLTDTYGPLHKANVPGQGTQQIRTHTHYLYDQGAPTTGGPYDLVTTKTETASLGAGIPGTSDTDARTTQYSYSNGTTSIGWTLRTPLQTIADPGGLAVTYNAVYNTDSTLYGGQPLPVKTCLPSDTTCSGAGTQQTIYYTAGANSVDSACGNKPAWADLTCKTKPAAQPTSGLPNLPVTSYTYNVYLEPLTKTETFGSSTRTTTYTYDAAGRQTRVSIATSGSGMGTPVDDQVTVYSPSTGLITDLKSVNSSGTVTGDIQSGYDDFGQLTSYTDAANNPTTYNYNLDGRVTSRNDGNGTVSYSYDTRGLITSETDSQAGTFTATYNPDANLASQTYPDGITGSYGYDETSTATTLSYAGGDLGNPLQNSIIPNAHGDWASQSISAPSWSLTASQGYSYDKADRLITVQDTQNGQCTTRSYNYNADSDRTSLTRYAPASTGACQATSGTAETYSYDTADRLISSTTGGTTSTYGYDTQGDITTTPSADAGGNGNLTATYYASGKLASQSQSSTSESWQLDPAGRSAVLNQTYGSDTEHFSNDGQSPAWTDTGIPSVWTRYVTGPSGMLGATVDSNFDYPNWSESVQLTDLHGNILATDYTTGYNMWSHNYIYCYTESGAPESATSSPATTNDNGYGWLGGNQISGEALGGKLLMGARAYSPATSRFDQVDPVYGGSANAYDYALQNPVTKTDLTGTSFQGYLWVGLWYSWDYSRWFFTWYANLWDNRYAQMAEYFISYTGGVYWHYKAGVKWFWKPNNHWWGGTLLPSWEQSWWIGAWVQLYWQGYRLLWGWFPIFDYGYSIPVWISGSR